MSLKDLEKYQENWYRTKSYFDFDIQHLTEEEEQERLERIKENRLKVKKVDLPPMSRTERDIEHALWELENERDNFFDNDLQLEYMANY